MLFGHIFFPDTPSVKVNTTQQNTEHGPAPAGYDGNKASQQKLGKKTLCHQHPQASTMGIRGVKWTYQLKGQKWILIPTKGIFLKCNITNLT